MAGKNYLKRVLFDKSMYVDSLSSMYNIDLHWLVKQGICNDKKRVTGCKFVYHALFSPFCQKKPVSVYRNETLLKHNHKLYERHLNGFFQVTQLVEGFICPKKDHHSKTLVV